MGAVIRGNRSINNGKQMLAEDLLRARPVSVSRLVRQPCSGETISLVSPQPSTDDQAVVARVVIILTQSLLETSVVEHGTARRASLDRFLLIASIN